MIPRGNLLIPNVDGVRLLDGEEPVEVMSRFRTLGCTHCTGAIRSSATTIEEIVAETRDVRSSERITRVIDHDTQGSMEKKKREGYF